MKSAVIRVISNVPLMIACVVMSQLFALAGALV